MRRPPNVLYLHSHYTGRYVEPYGHPVVTPNIQQLANQGVVFCPTRSRRSSRPSPCTDRATALTAALD